MNAGPIFVVFGSIWKNMSTVSLWFLCICNSTISGCFTWVEHLIFVDVSLGLRMVLLLIIVASLIVDVIYLEVGWWPSSDFSVI